MTIDPHIILEGIIGAGMTAYLGREGWVRVKAKMNGKPYTNGSLSKNDVRVAMEEALAPTNDALRDLAKAQQDTNTSIREFIVRAEERKRSSDMEELKQLLTRKSRRKGDG